MIYSLGVFMSKLEMHFGVVVSVIFYLFTQYRSTTGHPQCLDSDPPFATSGSKPLFCNIYKDFGCCTREQDAEIQKNYNRISAELKKNNIPNCESFLKDILCQSCSPYAAHVFEFQPNFPDLCDGYCNKMHRKCKDMIPYITKDKKILNYLNNKDKFCRDVASPDNIIYCWPDIIDNTDLNSQLERQTDSSVGCLCLKEFASDLYNPMRFRTPDDGTGRIFVLEQRGFIWVYTKDGQRSAKPFLNVTTSVKLANNRGNENGLIGFAFHPDYRSNRRFYVHYTQAAVRSSFDSLSVIWEYRAKEDKPNEVEPLSKRFIFTVNQPSSIHNAGELLFGPDGYLYIFLGDGGPNYDPQNHSQNRKTVLGSVLRIEVGDPLVRYRIPQDNPYVGIDEYRAEIWAYGVRNPWRADVDEGDPDTGYGKGRIFFGDVGQARFEELDILEKGGNFGWRGLEGDKCSKYPGIDFPRECEEIFPKSVMPIGSYSHNIYGNAVVPGHVYRGCHNPALNGLYIFGFHLHFRKGGRVFFLNETGPGQNQWQEKEVTFCGNDVCYNGWTNKFGRYVMGFGEDEDGEVYLMTSETALLTDGSGKIFRIVDPNRRGDPDSCRSVKNKNIKTTTTASVPAQSPEGCVLDTSWRYPKRLKVSVPGRRKKIKCNRCSCEKMESKHLKLLEAACNGNTQARVKCCPLCKKHGFI